MSFEIFYTVVKIFFPILFTLIIICRPAILSIPYLLLLLYIPFLSARNHAQLYKSARKFFKWAIFIAFTIVSSQTCLQIVLFLRYPKSLSIGYLGQFLQSNGFAELYKPENQRFCWCFLLDVVLCALCIVTYVIADRKSIKHQRCSDDLEESITPDEPSSSIYIRQQQIKLNTRTLLEPIAIFCVLSTLLVAAVLQPSIPNAVYFLAFLFIITAWSIDVLKHKAFHLCIWFLCIFMIIHLNTLFASQTDWLKPFMKQNSTLLRYIGLKSPIRTSNAAKGKTGSYSMMVSLTVDSLLNPLAILLCYYCSVIFLRDILEEKPKKLESKNIPMQSVNDENTANQIEDAKTFVKRFYHFVCRHSDIVSNLMMMIWSILFRKWSSIVFLLVVSVLWTRPIQQKYIRRINLFIVFYADVLLILHYFHCMTNMSYETPPMFYRAIYAELFPIGIVQYDAFACVPLLFQTICVFTFCFTLRQEGKNEHQTDDANRSSASFRIASNEGKTIWKCFDFSVNVLAHIWVAIILFTMFIYAIYGHEVNFFKLNYMIYVLIFVTTLQLSMRTWRDMMYWFWIFVIVSSMNNLILIYTYQFDGVEYFWTHYMRFDAHMQILIGLHRYETKELLIQLFYFTFLVGITAVHISFFHKRYTKQFVWERVENHVTEPDISEEEEESSGATDASEHKTYLERIVQGISFCIDVMKKLLDLKCSLIEMEFWKNMLIVGFSMCISEISALNLVIIVLIIFACRLKDVTPCIPTVSLLASIVVMLKMLYQLLKIPEDLHELFCVPDEHALTFTSITFCDVNTTAHWLGINKANEEENLFIFLYHYLGFILSATIFSLVLFYQARKRFMKGESSERPENLFPEITREDADKNIESLLKYLHNYVFYKFGMEITVVFLAVLICFRRDAISTVYILWICIILSVERRTMQSIWPIFQYFVAFLIVMQYAVTLNLPLFLQLSFEQLYEIFSWTESLIVLKNNPRKLLFDFFVLISVCRQRFVFQIERKFGGRKYPGGRNESAVRDIAIIISGQLPIRTHDFLYPRNWLDILKCIVYYSSFWVTLSIVLLTGCSNVSAFSLGYLMSSFLLCYIGTNFYKKPIHSILRWWNLLIAFNVFVITIKSILNMRLIIGGAFSTHHMLTSIHTFLSENKISSEPLDMGYDCLCFAFLIFQLRIFKSIDFCHIINDSIAIFVCDSRGTKLLADRMHEMHNIQMQREQETLDNIKAKVARIKANQRKFEPDLIAATTHHEAVQYRGKYLYEELVEKGEYDPRQNESKIEMGESFLLKNVNRIDATFRESNSLRRYESLAQINESVVERNENKTTKSYLMLTLRELLISITLHLYKFSRNYRYVHEILSKEKKMLKLKKSGQSPVAEEQTNFFAYQHSVFSEFVQALWFALIANTDVICYVLIFLSSIISMSLATLLLSLIVCLWGMLTIPRPSKNFWLMIIAYTEIMIFIHYFLQIISYFHNFEIGIPNATYNIILLHFVLFHRSVLKHMGIWTFTKKNNKNAVHVHALEMLNLSWFKSTACSDSIVQIPADVYTFMFLCDLINFFVLMFGFSTFSQSSTDNGLNSYLNEDRIHFRYLFTLLVQFILLIVDRALYLRRNMKGKIIFHVVSVIAVHCWQFMRLCHEHTAHSISWPPFLFYFIKCIYFLLSAYQIRCGYPKRVSGNFANNRFTLLHRRVFQIYNRLPFLPEARILLDWICIKTSLTLKEWFKMENIYSDMFIIKCNRQYEKTVPRPRGRSRGSKGDLLKAFFSLIVFFVLIWGPWAFFAFDRYTIGTPSIPYEVSVSLHAGSTEPFYRMSAQTSRIHRFTDSDLLAFKRVYANYAELQPFLDNYDENDIAAVLLDSNSTSLWTISPPNLRRFKNDLNGNETMKFRFTITVLRSAYKQLPERVETSQIFQLTANDLARQELLNALTKNVSHRHIHMVNLFPKFLRVTHGKGLQIIEQSKLQSDDGRCRNLTVQLHGKSNAQWWELKEDCNDAFYDEILSQLPYADCKKNIVLYTLNERMYSQNWSSIIGKGIFGLYSTYIFLTSNFFRQFLSKNISDIVRDDLPYVDRILKLCSDIYLAREQGDLKLEEDLYAKLIFLYRSPETMIRWTRLPDDETLISRASEIGESDAEKALRNDTDLRLI